FPASPASVSSSALPRPRPWSRQCLPHLPPAMSGSRATGAGTASSMSGCQAYMSCLLMLTRYGCPEAGSGTVAVGCGALATGGTGGGEIRRGTPRPPQAHLEIDGARESGLASRSVSATDPVEAIAKSVALKD